MTASTPRQPTCPRRPSIHTLAYRKPRTIPRWTATGSPPSAQESAPESWCSRIPGHVSKRYISRRQQPRQDRRISGTPRLPRRYPGFCTECQRSAGGSTSITSKPLWTDVPKLAIRPETGGSRAGPARRTRSPRCFAMVRPMSSRPSRSRYLVKGVDLEAGPPIAGGDGLGLQVDGDHRAPASRLPDPSTGSPRLR